MNSNLKTGHIFEGIVQPRYRQKMAALDLTMTHRFSDEVLILVAGHFRLTRPYLLEETPDSIQLRYNPYLPNWFSQHKIPSALSKK